MQKGLALFLPALLFGFLVATQWSTIADPASRNVQIRYVDPLTATVARLQDEQTSLKGQLSGVREQLDLLQQGASEQSGTMSDLHGRIERLRAAAGLAPAAGAGIVVTLAAGRPLLGAEPERAGCLAPDLADVVNALWHAGATAIAIDGERIVTSSSVYCVGGTIVVNGSIVSAPFAVSAIGPASAMLAAFDDPSQLTDVKQRRDRQVISVDVARSSRVAVPAYSGPVRARSAVAQ